MSRHPITAGQKFGWLTAVEIVGRAGKTVFWKCKCDCGSYANVRSGNLSSGHTQSCGCQRQRNTRKHGGASRSGETAEYKTWKAVISRCFDKNHKQYADYGGRGIVMCDEWRNDFALFLAAIGPKPTPVHTIGRINNDLGYQPGNVEWQTRRQQQNNMRSNHFVVHDGRRQTVAQWSRELGIPVSTVQRRAAKDQRLDVRAAHAAVEALRGGK